MVHLLLFTVANALIQRLKVVNCRLSIIDFAIGPLHGGYQDIGSKLQVGFLWHHNHLPSWGVGKEVSLMAMQSIQIRLESEELDWLDEEAYRNGGSRGSVIRSLIREKRGNSRQPSPEASCKCC